MRDKQGILGVVQLADSKKKVRLDLLHLAMLILMTVLFFSVQRKRRPKLKFHRPKAHAPHRRPGLLRRLIQQQKLLG